MDLTAPRKRAGIPRIRVDPEDLVAGLRESDDAGRGAEGQLAATFTDRPLPALSSAAGATRRAKSIHVCAITAPRGEGGRRTCEPDLDTKGGAEAGRCRPAGFQLQPGQFDVGLARADERRHGGSGDAKPGDRCRLAVGGAGPPRLLHRQAIPTLAG